MSERPIPEPVPGEQSGPGALPDEPPVEAQARGGAQVIPRPPTWRPGPPAPWAEVPGERRHPTLAQVRAALAQAVAPQLSPLEVEGIRGSAVLAPLYEHDGEVHVVLTRRAQHLRSHRGEVSFPGGGQDEGESLQATAIREAWEEIGLDPATVEIIAELHHLRTVTSQSFIVPFVGVLPGRPELVANPAEVERILHVPLSELLADGVYHEEDWGFVPLERNIAFFEVAGDTIWGATGWMLRDLLARVVGLGDRGARRTIEPTD
jgi:8-oxo-dGTP pyrophosphatase MutT (NUDIX family)